MSTGTIKLAKGEADKLARFIERNCRPQLPVDQAEMVHWLKRLQGGRS